MSQHAQAAALLVVVVVLRRQVQPAEVQTFCEGA